MSWVENSLGSLCEEITVGYVSSMANEYIDIGIPFLRSLNIEPYKLNLKPEQLKFISAKFHQKLSKSKLNARDLAIVRTGLPGTCCVIPKGFGEVNCSDLVIARPKKSVDPYFLCYYINSPFGRGSIGGNLVGVAQKHFNVGVAKRMIIPTPPLQTQKRIANILSGYDNLIENNLKRIKLLEQAAQNIYKEWFVNLRFPGHENTSINEETGLHAGWKNLKFGSVFNVQNGYAFKSKDYRNKGVPVLRTRDYSSSFFINISDPIFLPEEFSDSHKKYFVKELDFLLIMVGASIGKNGLVLKKDLPALQNQNQWAIRVKSEYSSYEYFKIYCVKTIIDSLLMKRTGAARDFFRASFIKEMDVQIPNKDLVKQFTKNVKPCIEQINLLLTQNQKLKAARDILLPRLMNRTIEV